MKKWVRGGDPQLQRQWEGIVRQWQKSGQAVRAFCRAEGLRESAFYFWRREMARRKGQRKEQCKEQKKQLAKKGKPVSVEKPSFLPVHVVASSVGSEAARGGVEIVLAQGRVVRVAPGFDRQTLADVLSILEPRPC